MMPSRRILLWLGAALALAACAAQPAHNESLERARSRLTEAAAEPNVERYARSELESAQDAFADAERSARRGLSPQVTEHWAYLAEQRAAIARESGRLRHAEAEIRAAEAARAQAAISTAGLPSASGAADRSTAAAGGALVTLVDQDFVREGFALKPDAEPGIARVVEVLQQDPARVARIEGHSDDQGERGRSLAFSGRRAEAVRGELTRRGIDPRRLSVRVVGDASPLASNDTELGRERNRRVEIFVLNPADSTAQ
jgi:OOP family OmpA-OmpF porin